MHKDPLNLVLTGIGGQGIVSLSKLLCEGAIEEGYYVTFAQTYPSQQRGGSVVNYVRMSKKEQYGPIIPNGKADVIVGLEPLETLRILKDYGNKDVHVVMDPTPKYPIDVADGKLKYPEISNLINIINKISKRTWLIDAAEVAYEIGNSLVSNIVILGVIIAIELLPISPDRIEDLLKIRFAKQYNDNLSAFKKGFELGDFG